MTRPIFLAAFLTLSTTAFASTISRETLAAVVSIGEAAGVPRSVTLALMREESGGYAAAIGKEGGGYKSRGLFQLHDRWIDYLVDTYWTGGKFDVMDPLDNATVALRYLGALHERFGNWSQALWFYNSGKWRRVEVPEKTQEYARRIVNAH